MVNSMTGNNWRQTEPPPVLKEVSVGLNFDQAEIAEQKSLGHYFSNLSSFIKYVAFDCTSNATVTHGKTTMIY